MNNCIKHDNPNNKKFRAFCLFLGWMTSVFFREYCLFNCLNFSWIFHECGRLCYLSCWYIQTLTAAACEYADLNKTWLYWIISLLMIPAVQPIRKLYRSDKYAEVCCQWTKTTEIHVSVHISLSMKSNLAPAHRDTPTPQKFSLDQDNYPVFY